MGIEEKLDALTAAIIANTASHDRLAAVATAAAGGKATPATAKAEEASEEEEEKTETAAAKKKRLAAEKKAKEAAAAAAAEEEEEEPEAPTLKTKVTGKALHTLASDFMSDELDDAERDANKANFISGLGHIGAKKISELETDESRARLAGYIQYWTAGLDVDFDEIDALVGFEAADDPMG